MDGRGDDPSEVLAYLDEQMVELERLVARLRALDDVEIAIARELLAPIETSSPRPLPACFAIRA